MARYHINSKGEAGQCRAQKGFCPFGGEESHFSTPEAAREAFEKSQEGTQEVLKKTKIENAPAWFNKLDDNDKIKLFDAIEEVSRHHNFSYEKEIGDTERARTKRLVDLAKANYVKLRVRRSDNYQDGKLIPGETYVDHSVTRITKNADEIIQKLREEKENRQNVRIRFNDDVRWRRKVEKTVADGKEITDTYDSYGDEEKSYIKLILDDWENDGKGFTLAGFQEKTGLSRNQAINTLRKLHDDGLVRQYVDYYNKNRYNSLNEDGFIAVAEYKATEGAPLKEPEGYVYWKAKDQATWFRSVLDTKI